MSHATSGDLQAEIDFGGPQDGTPNYSGTYNSIKCALQDYNYNGGSTRIDLAGRCDEKQKIKVLRAQETLEMVVKVPLTGKLFVDVIGTYVRVRITHYTGATPEVYEGVISDVRDSSPFDQVQTQSVTVQIGAA